MANEVYSAPQSGEGEHQEIILVDENDNLLGFEEKLAAHQGEGKLHRAFSLFIFNSSGQLLLQRRAIQKYHFGGLWTNTCCSHPRKDEELLDAAHRRLREELGFDTDIKEISSFIYRACDERSGLTEHELDHVLVGQFDGQPRPDAAEIDDWRWVDLEPLILDMQNNPGLYTPWFKIAIDRVIEWSLTNPPNKTS